MLINFILPFSLITVINCRMAQSIQHINQCTSDEYFNVNYLKCVKCEQMFNHQSERDLFNVLYPKTFNLAFSSNLISDNQNFSHHSHHTSTNYSTSNQIQVELNLEKSEDGLSCVCKRGMFRLKRHYSKSSNELFCIPCPKRMVSSLNRNACSFCKEIPEIYMNNKNHEIKNQRVNHLQNYNERSSCVDKCEKDEILIERPINSIETINLNFSALIVDYNYIDHFNVTQLLIQECVRCPWQTKPINNHCEICHYSTENCVCLPENGLTTVLNNGVCILKNQISNFNQELFKINYTIIEKSKNELIENQYKISSYVKANFHSSFSQCNYYHNITACQQFSNLCVLDHYRLKTTTSQLNVGKVSGLDLNTICDVYMEMNKQMPIDYLPQIYFTKDENTKDFLFKKNLKIEYKLNERLRFHMVVFNANGKFKESRETYINELIICSSRDQSFESMVRFAVNIEFKCNIEVHRLFKNTPINGEEQLLYELYLILDQTSPDNQTSSIKDRILYPIYILNRNLLKNGQLANREGYLLDYFNYYLDHSNYFSEMINRWQLVKRFFVAEQLTSKENFGGKPVTTNERYKKFENSNINYNEYGSILRYVNRMKLMIRTNTESPHLIYPPILIFEYSHITKELLENQPDKTVKIELDIHFESSEIDLYKNLTIFLAVFGSLVVILSLFRTWAWSRRSNNDNTLNLVILLKFILFNCDYLANVFFLLVLLISIHSFLIYKFQSVVYCFLPSKSLEHFLQLYLILAFILKSISILHEFYIRSYVDVFFIDWEKSTSRSSRISSLNSKIKNTHNLNNNRFEKSQDSIRNIDENDASLYQYINQKNTLNDNVDNQTVNGNNENLQQKILQNEKLDKNGQFVKSSQIANQFNQNAKYIDRYPDVSIWRTLFVANEYCELATYRRVSISYHLFILLIVLQCFGVDNFARADLELTFNSKENQRYVANSFTGRFAVGCLTFLLTVFVNYAFTKYYLEPFVCDKISEFVDFCSVSNVSLFCLLHEKYGYYVHGKNPTGRSEVNMPEMHHNLLTEEEDLCAKRGLLANSDIQCFQMFLNDKLVINYKKIRELLKHKTQYGLRAALHKTQNVQKIWYSYYLMNKLLSGFIDHMFVEMDYIVKKRSSLEMLLDAEFNDIRMLDKSIFFADKFHSFKNVLLVGVEIDVILLELMFFTLIDLLTFNYIAAIAFTFILNQILEWIFLTMAKKNLIRKSLVDERFLL